MKQILFSLLALLAISAGAQTGAFTLGKIHNELVNRDLDVKVLAKSGNVFWMEIECPISAYLTGTIRIKADDVQPFRDALGKVRPAMDIYINRVENEGYDGNLGITGFPTVTYLWGGTCADRDADFIVILRKDDGKYLASIAREAADGDETAQFFMQFESLDEIDFLLDLISDENIAASIRK